jgi:hypothetical protein
MNSVLAAEITAMKYPDTRDSEEYNDSSEQALV